ncbi:MAG: ankyrin repeat domain-containing protein, partial [Akkermansiaceae bacterium]|nr:ankyrin repeat domain-containing protein [Verrucomicrobiales bacterium]
MFLHSSFFILPSLAAATNDLSGLLQKGLFEEEANRNLDAATTAYQTLVTQLDKDRQIGATAIFRLGEVYRKQGKTNEAAVQYERIVRDFAEQTTLVTLSRQNLAGLNKRSDNLDSKTSPKDSEPDLAQLKKLSQAELLQVLPTLVPDQLLTKLLEQLSAADADYAQARQDLSSEHPQIKRLNALRESLHEQIDQRVSGILKALELRSAASATGKSTATVTTVPGDEEAEIRRIQAMIKDSPDLINAKEPATGSTPLHSAAYKGQLTVAQFLLANGADVEARDRQWGGRTPLQYAAGAGHKAMVDLLLSKKANVNSADNTGNTALHLAVVNGFRSVVEVLVAGGANVNAQRRTGVTPLHLAVVNGYQNMA